MHALIGGATEVVIYRSRALESLANSPLLEANEVYVGAEFPSNSIASEDQSRFYRIIE